MEENLLYMGEKLSNFYDNVTLRTMFPFNKINQHKKIFNKQIFPK